MPNYFARSKFQKDIFNYLFYLKSVDFICELNMLLTKSIVLSTTSNVSKVHFILSASESADILCRWNVAKIPLKLLVLQTANFHRTHSSRRRRKCALNSFVVESNILLMFEIKKTWRMNEFAGERILISESYLNFLQNNLPEILEDIFLAVWNVMM